MIEQFSFSSDGPDPVAKFEEYARLYSNGSDVSSSGEPFHAQVRAWKLDRFLIFDRRLNGVVHERSARVDADGFDHLILHYVVSGRLDGSALSRFEVAEPGDLVLLDATRPSRTTPRNAHLITASVARPSALAGLGSLGDIHGRIVRPPESLLLGDFLMSIVNRSEFLTDAALPHVGRALVDLLAGAWSDLSLGSHGRHREAFLRMQAIDRCIRHRLADRGLSAEIIANDTGVSRSSLYRTLEPHGGVARYIQKQRLEALRTRLWLGATAPLSVLATELGFANEAHMSRLFSEMFGLSPSACREASRDGSGVEAAHLQWEGWMTGVQSI